MDDDKPQYILMATQHKSKPKVYIRLLKIKKEDNKSFADIMKNIESKKQIETIVREKVTSGKATKPWSIYDNYNLFLDQEIDVKREQIKPYFDQAGAVK